MESFGLEVIIFNVTNNSTLTQTTIAMYVDDTIINLRAQSRFRHPEEIIKGVLQGSLSKLPHIFFNEVALSKPARILFG